MIMELRWHLVTSRESGIRLQKLILLHLIADYIGAVAQLGEHLRGTQGVGSSNLLCSTFYYGIAYRLQLELKRGI